MRPSFSHSPGGSLTGRGTGKDLKICCCSHSPSKTNAPLIISHNAPCTEASVISGYEKAQESDRFPQPGAEEEKKERGKASSFSVSTTYSPPVFNSSACSLCICGKHLGSFIPTQAGLRTPVPSRVAGSERASVWVLVVVEERSLRSPLACLDHLKAPIHPFPCFARPPAHPRCPEAWLV